MSYPPKHARLSRRAFEQYFKTGRRVHSPTLQLIYTPLTSGFHGAVVVGKKVAKRATQRNKVRRQLYARLYRLKNTHHLTGVFILVAKPSINTTQTQEFSEQVAEVIGRVHKKQ